jgi:hypothetical protein
MKEIIHIGFSKTASSWFQEYFFPYIKNINFINSSIIKEKIININSFNFDSFEVREYFKNNSTKRILLSHENLIGPVVSGGFNGIATKELGERIKSVFPEAEIMIFIRNQPDIIASAYLQEIWEGSTYNINSFLFHKGRNLYNKMMMFSFTYFEYDKIIKYYSELFGEKKIHIFLYEDFLNNPSEFLANLSSVFDFDIDISLLKNDKNNTRLRKGLIPFVKTANIFTKRNTIFKYYLMNFPYWFWFSRKLFYYLNKCKIFGNSGSSVLVLGKKNYNYIFDYYKNSNNKLYSNYGLTSIKNYNYPL